jgi:hypothetical protein
MCTPRTRRTQTSARVVQSREDHFGQNPMRLEECHDYLQSASRAIRRHTEHASRSRTELAKLGRIRLRVRTSSTDRSKRTPHPASLVRDGDLKPAIDVNAHIFLRRDSSTAVRSLRIVIEGKRAIYTLTACTTLGVHKTLCVGYRPSA